MMTNLSRPKNCTSVCDTVFVLYQFVNWKITYQIFAGSIVKVVDKSDFEIGNTSICTLAPQLKVTLESYFYFSFICKTRVLLLNL